MKHSKVPAPETFFDRLADKVSYGMGTPLNIIIWIVIIGAWTFIFAAGIVSTDATFLPKWVSSPTWNFPVNTGTSIAELYIGFLVAAAANRNERTARELNKAQAEMIAAIKNEDDELVLGDKSMAELLVKNTDLCNAIHELTEQMHEHMLGDPEKGKYEKPAPPAEDVPGFLKDKP